MEVTFYLGTVETIRQAMAVDAATAIAARRGVPVTPWDPGRDRPLAEIDAQPDLFASPTVLLCTAAVGEWGAQIAPVTGSGGGNHLIWTAGAIPAAVKALNLPTVTCSAKGHAGTAKVYLDSVGLPKPVVAALSAHVGKELALLPNIVTALRTRYPDGLHTLTPAQALEAAGPAAPPAPWDLTDAIDRGDVTTALRLARAQSASKTGPIGVVSIIQRHLNLIARLVAGTPRDADAAAAMIGHTGSTYPLTKALQAARRYGPSVASLALLADRAAADVRGASALDNGVIVDILVARVAASRQPRR